MSPRPKALMSWSSGKDCAFALAAARAAGELDVVGLLTTMNETVDRVTMHGVRRELLNRQAESLGLRQLTVEIPDPCTNEVYGQRMGAFVEEALAEGIEAVIFGDIHLEDVRVYRERQLAGTGIEPVFPLFGRQTSALAEAMWAAGVAATLTCVDTRKLPAELLGRPWDATLVSELPSGVDPCGEFGEFHSFVSDAPGFAQPVEVRTGEVVIRGDFAFLDLLPR